MAYINPNDDLNINMGRLLVLISATHDVSKREDILTFDRLVLYDFLAKSPVLLIKILNILGKRHKINIRDNESGSLSDNYINKSSMYNYKPMKKLLQILFVQNNIKINGIDREQLAIQITDSGKTLCQNLSSEYFNRFKELAVGLQLLNSTKPLALRGHINFLLNV